MVKQRWCVVPQVENSMNELKKTQVKDLKTDKGVFFLQLTLMTKEK